MLPNHADTGGQGFGRRGKNRFLSVGDNHPFGSFKESRHDVHKGGFSCAVFSNQRVNLSFLQFKVRPVKSLYPVRRKTLVYFMKQNHPHNLFAGSAGIALTPRRDRPVCFQEWFLTGRINRGGLRFQRDFLPSGLYRRRRNSTGSVIP